MTMKVPLGVAFATLLTVTAVCRAQYAVPADWSTWGYDQERSGWNRGETTLSAENVSRLELKWKTKLSTVPNETVLSTLTAPLVVHDVMTAQGLKTLVFLVGSDDEVFALDGTSGRIIWQKAFARSLSPREPATWLCPNAQNSTPVIDREAATMYFVSVDGRLHALNISNGQERFPPTEFITPFARSWSLNLIDHVIYTSVARGCGGTASNVAAMDLTDPFHATVTHFYTSTGRPAGAWGRGGIVKGPGAVYEQTADGPYAPGADALGQSLVALTFKKLELSGSFTPENWQELNHKDLDFGSASPITFPFDDWTLLAAAGKESVVYLLSVPERKGGGTRKDTPVDAKQLVPLYQSPRWGNDDAEYWGHGVWGSMATYKDTQGERWIYMPMWGPPAKDANFTYTYGPAPAGSIMGFRVTTQNNKPALIPVWRSAELQVPDPPVVANGVVFATQTGENTHQALGARAKPVSNLSLHAFDARTGKELYSSRGALSGWVHFGEPVVANGLVFLTSWDSYVYCFGLKP
jgi:outer membrane protein assembly factor BamB